MLSGILPGGRSMAGDEASLEVTPRGKPARRFRRSIYSILKSRQAMTNTEQDRWSRVKGRLRSSVGEDVYSSWFARMDLESVQPESVKLSVPTMFLKSWIQAHYAARQVAEGRRGDSVMFNPLYIHAGVGLGKTHLLQAVTWAGNSGIERKVLYLTAEKFMYGFV